MSSSLSQIPVEKRKHVAAVLGLFAVLFVAVGAVAATGPSSAVLRTFVAVAVTVGVLLALLAWGVVRSISLDRADADLDALIEDAVTQNGASMCDCGHEHDPTELHVTDDPCDKDGHGHECTHTCDTCVLQSLRRPAATVGTDPAPASTAGRPAPGPRRPSPSPR